MLSRDSFNIGTASLELAASPPRHLLAVHLRPWNRCWSELFLDGSVTDVANGASLEKKLICNLLIRPMDRPDVGPCDIGVLPTSYPSKSRTMTTRTGKPLPRAIDN